MYVYMDCVLMQCGLINVKSSGNMSSDTACKPGRTRTADAKKSQYLMLHCISYIAR